MDKNLNLLSIFVTLAEEKSLTRAAEKLRLSQPTLSYSLKKLREDFSDPLFVRVSKGIALTPAAQELLPKVKSMLSQVDDLYLQSLLTPDRYEGQLSIAATPYFEVQVLKSLIERLGKEAPQARLKTISLRGEIPLSKMEDGSIDVSIAAYFDDLPERFFVRNLGKDRQVLIVRKSHPFLRTNQTLEDYLELQHIRIALGARDQGRVDEVLSKKNLRRRIVAQVGDFLSAPLLVENSDYALAVPERLARIYQTFAAVTVTELPVRVEPIEIKMIWHSRNQSDPVQKWLRNQIVDCFK